MAPPPGLQIGPGKVQLKELGFRWASCAANGDLRFHWKCLMAPLKVIDYIVVHELCHMRYRDHSDAFWNEVDKVLPDIENDLQELRQILALERKRRSDEEMTELVTRAGTDPAAYEQLRQRVEAQKKKTSP